jgi:type II secretory pathway pseudopilin PulG
MRRKVVLVTLAVIALALLLAGLLIPHYVTTLRQAREYTRRQNLVAMRAVINQYTLDKNRDGLTHSTI